MRRISALLLALIAMVGAAVLGATSAVAYPVSTQAQIFASTTTPFAGEHIEVSGATYQPNEDVLLYIGGTYVGTAHTNGQGAFDPSVIVPFTQGQRPLVGVGAAATKSSPTDCNGDTDCSSLILTVQPGSGVSGVSTAASHSAAAGSVGRSSGGLPFTGVPLVALIVLALLLLGGGTAFTMSARRRKASAHA